MMNKISTGKKETMKSKLIVFSLVICTLPMTIACSDFLYDDSDIVTYSDKEFLNSDADTLWSVVGIINKMQAIADRTILLGELRGDLVTVTANADADLRDVSQFNM